MTHAVLTPNYLRPFTFVSLISKRSRLYHSVLNDIPSNRLWTPLATRLSNRVHGARVERIQWRPYICQKAEWIYSLRQKRNRIIAVRGGRD